MEEFSEIDFRYTQDGTAGLYDNKTDDIFHSASGALKEAFDKFINPINESFIEFDNNVNVLDICYGVGYNSKALLNTLSILYDSVNIDALEYNKSYVYMSPFLNDGITDDDLKIFLIKNLINTQSDLDLLKGILSYLVNNKSEFMSPFGMTFFNLLSDYRGINTPIDEFKANLHNIYYKYISDSMMNGLKFNNYNKSVFNAYYGDARKSVFNTIKQYDVIFLDAFSPKKDPVLWTINFLSAVKSKMKKNSLLISYSKSTPFRSALLELGFFVGKTIHENEDIGTIASLNPAYIRCHIDYNDKKIIDSKSGIPYRDELLNLSGDEIIKNREKEAVHSDRPSRTQTEKDL